MSYFFRIVEPGGRREYVTARYDMSLSDAHDDVKRKHPSYKIFVISEEHYNRVLRTPRKEPK